MDHIKCLDMIADLAEKIRLDGVLALTRPMKEILGDKADKVVLSSRVADSPLVARHPD
jgi:hypothetical protein